MAVLPVIRGQNVMKLGRIDPSPYQRVPSDPFGFLATRGSSLFSKWAPKTAFWALQLIKVEFSLALLVPGQSNKFTVMHLIFLATRDPNLFNKQNPQMALWRVWGLDREFQLGPSLACQPKAPTSECLLPSFFHPKPQWKNCIKYFQ